MNQTKYTGETHKLPGMPAPQVPTSKILDVGRKVKDPINQADIFKPTKIKRGNLPQDQKDLGL
jgi:hypothetical protein